MSCFEILEHPGAKDPDFGNPLAANGAQNGAKIIQMVPKRVCRALGVDTFWGSQNRLASKITFGALQGTILIDFGDSSARKFDDFRMMLHRASDDTKARKCSEKHRSWDRTVILR